MLKAVIIEDEKILADKLEKSLQELGIEVLEKIESVKKGKAYFDSKPNIDLVFSDIQLGDGLSLEIFSEGKNYPFIIFTTAFDQYTLEAFKLNSIDYLLKPISKTELEKSIQKYKQLKNAISPDFQELMAQFTKDKKYKNHFLLKLGNYLHSVPVEEINLVYSENKITYLKTDKAYVTDDSLNDIQNQLNPQKFFRVSRQFIVSRKAIKEIKSYQNSRLQLRIKNHPDPIIVSRERVSDFKNWLNS